MSGHTYTHTHIHTYTHDNYYNPRCAHAHRGLIIQKGEYHAELNAPIAALEYFSNVARV